MTIDIVDFPINSMVIFHSYVTVHQRVFLELVGSVYDWCGTASGSMWKSQGFVPSTNAMDDYFS